jgi:plasmid stabilization system protein ParE
VNIKWSFEARDDVDRLADFIAAYDPVLASEIEQELAQSPEKLVSFPRRGVRLSAFDPREVREFRVNRYLLRYELVKTDIYVLRFFQVREDRFPTK